MVFFLPLMVPQSKPMNTPSMSRAYSSRVMCVNGMAAPSGKPFKKPMAIDMRNDPMAIVPRNRTLSAFF